MSGFGKPTYGYSGKPKKHMIDDDEDEPTRKIAGPGVGISMSPMSPMVSHFAATTSALSKSATQSTQLSKLTANLSDPDSKLASEPFQWNLTEVPALPPFYHLERTAVFVDNAARNPSQVSSRISSVLRERCIEASYDEDKAKARCLSPSGVDFRVRLYRGRGEYDHGVIVEVQRRFGCALDFFQDTNAILDAAKGLTTVKPSSVPPHSSTRNCLPPVVISDGEDNDDDDVPSDENGLASLAMVSKMLFTVANVGGEDSDYLALQTLGSLTDSTKIGSRATAKSVSQELLKPGNAIGEKLLDIITSKKQQNEECFNLKLMALTILGNALSAIQDETGVAKVPEIVCEALRPTLLKELEQANASNLLAAQQAARCSEYLWRGDHNIGELQGALEAARTVGRARHYGLEQQAQRTISRIMEAN